MNSRSLFTIAPIGGLGATPLYNSAAVGPEPVDPVISEKLAAYTVLFDQAIAIEDQKKHTSQVVSQLIMS